MPSNQSGQSGAGDSPGNQGSDVTQGEQSNSQVDPNNNPSDNSPLREFDSIFAPSRIGDDGSNNQVDLQGNPTNEDAISEREAGLNQQFSGTSRIPYGSVYADYADRATEALNTDYIPLGVRDVIRTYFSSLEP